jgi:hypothetical protein
MIDWTKPVEFTDGTPVRVERVLADGTAILSWVSCGTFTAAVHSPYILTMRNVPSKPREWWALVSLSTGNLVGGCVSKGDAIHYVREVLKEYPVTEVHVREVLP